MIPQRLLPLLVASLLLGACAGQADSRRLAGQTAGLLNDYRREVDQVAQRQTSLNADNDARLRTLDSFRTATQTETERRLTALKAADDKRAQALYALYAARALDQLLASPPLHAPAPVPVKTASFDGAAVQAVVKQLKTLETAPTLSERFTGLKDYYGALQATYAASLKTAAGEAKAAQDAAAAEDKKTISSVNTP